MGDGDINFQAGLLSGSYDEPFYAEGKAWSTLTERLNQHVRENYGEYHKETN